MKTLFRNPFFHLLKNLAGLFLFIPAIAWGIGGVQALEVSLEVLLLIVTAIVGLTLTAFGHGWMNRFKEWRRHDHDLHRFLCPACLHLERFTFACSNCEEEVEPFQVHTNGVYFDQCVQCQQQLFIKSENESDRVKAYCKNCFATWDRSIYHERQVRVQATVLVRDFSTLQQIENSALHTDKEHNTFFCVETPQTLNYVINFDSNRQLPETPKARHALSHLDTIWLDVAGVDVLQVGQALDALIRQLDLSDDQCRKIVICVQQTTIDSVLKNRLESQFGAVRYGVSGQMLWYNESPSNILPHTSIQDEISNQDKTDVRERELV